MNSGPITNALTVYLEDYFHVAAFGDSIDRKTWDSFESRVEKNTHKFHGRPAIKTVANAIFNVKYPLFGHSKN